MELLKGTPDSKTFNRQLNEAKRIVELYGWENEYTYPYSFPIKIKNFLEGLESYDKMTYMSKELATDELNGFIKHCINPWVAYENAPKVEIKLKTGKVMKTTKELAEVIIDEGLGEYDY